MKTMNDAARAAIATGWATSALTQQEYAALHSISERTLRSWIARYASRQPPVEQVRAIVMDAIERLQAVLDGLGAPGGMPEGDEVDDVVQDDLEPTSTGMPDGSEEEPENEEPSQPTAIVRLSAGPVPAPPPMPPARPARPRPAPTQPDPTTGPKVSRRSFFYGM